MILETLRDFYLQQQHALNLPAYGFEEKQIPFIIVLTSTGTYVTIEDTRQQVGKRQVAQSFLVPKGVKRTSGIKANLLWDSAEYALEVDIKESPETTAEQHRAFINTLSPYTSLAEVQAVINFLQGEKYKLTQSPVWSEICETSPLISFRIETSEKLVCQCKPFTDLYPIDEKGGWQAPCLITGERSPVERIHPSIKKLYGAQSSGANIVSFNSAAYTSWNKKQGDNAPMGRKAVFEYTTALNYLLSNKNENQFRVKNTTYLFWSTKKSMLSSIFKDFFKPSFEGTNRVSRSFDQYNQLLDELSLYKPSANTHFFILALDPNNSRIIISLWRETPEPQIAIQLKQWLQDIRIDKKDKLTFPCLLDLLTNSVREHKEQNLSNRQGCDTIQAVLDGQPLPFTLVEPILQKVRVKGEVNYLRAGLLKAYINRLYRSKGGINMQLKADLDEDNNQAGYVLGRLFAVFEKLQTEAHKHTSITSRYYSAASSRPQTVFNTLFASHIHHLKKLQNPARAINFQKMIGELSQKLQMIPSYLNSEQQCLFAVGYYHQRQFFFTPKNSENTEDNSKELEPLEEPL